MRPVSADQLIEIELSAAERRKLFERAPHTVTLTWFDRRLAARFDRPEPAGLFQERYGAFASTGVPELWSCAVQSGNDAGEPIFWTEPGAAYRYPARVSGAQVMAFLADAVTNRAFFDVTPELLSFHAAALRVGEAAAAISALSTGGKSTTAIACVRRGMGLYSDERCVLRDGRVQAFPRAVNIRQGGLELLSSEDVNDDEGIGLRLRAHLNDDWISASFAELIGDRPRPAPAKLEAIFFIVARKAIPSVKLMPLGEAIVRLLSAGLCGPKPGLDRVAAAAALCRQSRAYELTLGTPDDTALLIGATMQPSSPSLALGL